MKLLILRPTHCKLAGRMTVLQPGDFWESTDNYTITDMIFLGRAEPAGCPDKIKILALRPFSTPNPDVEAKEKYHVLEKGDVIILPKREALRLICQRYARSTDDSFWGPHQELEEKRSIRRLVKETSP
jgi:hypothetical protein